ncbi:MAG: RNA polymerase sigma factor [candidate division KSB1 bacterium]|nr:RNA polymerase sigma factor [candidate division KSB1 bacterium]
MQRHKDRVYRFALYMLGHREDAEDVVQEAFIRLWRMRSAGAVRSWEGWLMRVTHNLCIDRLRRRQLEQRTLSPLEEAANPDSLLAASLVESDPEKQTECGEYRRLLLQAIRKLPDPLRVAVLLREVESMPYRDIAEAMQVPLHSVRTYLHRARKQLRIHLKSYFHQTTGSRDDL